MEMNSNMAAMAAILDEQQHWFLNEMARAIVLTSCEETVKYPQ
jgi:hypothetical protein